MLNVTNIKYIVYIESVDMYNSLIKYIYHCSYLSNIFYVTHSAMQTVSVYFVFDYIRVSFIVCGRLYLS